MTRYRSLQSLRAIAALLVVYYHAVLQLQSALGRPDSSLPLFGAAGVDLFFVISGFVMWTSTAGRSMRPLAFYARRLTRIVPLYWAVTLAACAIAIAAPQLLRSTRFEWPHALASLLFMPWSNPGLPAAHPDLLSPVVIPGWTLNYEMFFYLLFGAALLVPQRQRPWAIAALILLSVSAAYALAPLVPNLSFYANSMPLEFLAGVIIAWGATRFSPIPRRFWPIATGILLILLCSLDAAALQLVRFLRLGIVAALVIITAVAAERAGVAPRLKWLDRLGDASFSIYLIHIFVIAGLRGGVGLAGLTVNEASGEILFVAAALLGSIAIGLAVYHLFERPVSGALNRRLFSGAAVRPSARSPQGAA